MSLVAVKDKICSEVKHSECVTQIMVSQLMLEMVVYTIT